MLVRILLAAATFLVGSLIGALAAGRFLVPAGSGLAGPAIALGYGLVAGVGAAVILWVLSGRWSERFARLALLPIGGLGLLSLALVGWAYVVAHRQQSEALQEAYARLPEFEIQLRFDDAVPDRRFTVLAHDSRQQRLTVRRRDGGKCSTHIEGMDEVRLLESLRGVEGLAHRDARPCAPVGARPEFSLTFTVAEARPPATHVEIEGPVACLRSHAELRALAELLEGWGSVAVRGAGCE